MNSLSNSAPSEKMDGERGWRFFGGGGGGILSPCNSLLNWALDRCARRLDPEREEGGNWEFGGAEPEGRV